MSTETTNSVIERYEREGVVCPSNFRVKLFTTAIVDNTDHNPSSSTSQSSFHGTAVSLVHPSNGELGSSRDMDGFYPNTPSITNLICRQVAAKLHGCLRWTILTMPGGYRDVCVLPSTHPSSTNI